MSILSAAKYLVEDVSTVVLLRPDSSLAVSEWTVNRYGENS
jgi:hypothetical protein